MVSTNRYYKLLSGQRNPASLYCEPMHAVFYDLETTDKEPIGQILNYSFIHVDDKFRILSELHGLVRISRLQLPRVSAILANRTNVIEHQQLAKLDETDAMKRISDYLVEIANEARGPVAFIGYNSARFDLMYLRTSFIRNGLNPYAWSKTFKDRDLLHCARKLSCSSAQFPRVASATDPQRLSLRLESLCQNFGLLTGAQRHESREDVILTIELAKLFKEKFGLDPRSYNAYEGLDLDNYQRTPTVFSVVDTNYDLSAKESRTIAPHALLCSDNRCGLWINLERYKSGEGRASISYRKKNGGYLFLDRDHRFPDDWSAVAQKAQAEFPRINTGNFFEKSTCDIEQFIYRLDFDGRDNLTAAIWKGEGKALAHSKDREAKALMLRYKLRRYEWGGDKDAEVEEALRAYVKRRYGGQLQLSKQEEEPDSEAGKEAYHISLPALWEELNAAAATAKEGDRELIAALQQFYRQSDIFRLCAADFNLAL